MFSNIIKIKSNLQDVNLDENSLRSKSAKLLVDIEGDVKIYINNRTYFEMENFCVAELGFHLFKWLEDLKSGTIKHFEYDSMDEDWKVIKFINIENNEWIITSPYETSICNIKFTTNELKASVEEFIIELNKQLFELYNLNIEHIK